MARTSKGTSPKRARKPDPDAVQDEEATLSIDQILDGLEGVVAELEAGELPLEEALRRFEHGVSLARRGSTVLDAVEERVEQLLADRDEVVPFGPEEP
ncbi:MAG: exodeoxyribonuclease VII small subunit [Nannocystaceae bacterium]